MTFHDVFLLLVAMHITTGAPGLIGFWLPVISKKGGPRHRLSGRAFSIAMLATGASAICMATLTLIAPMETHPHLRQHPDFSDPALVRAVFGWMMLFLAILTVNLAWYGWRCAANKRHHHLNRKPINFASQVILFIAAINCAVQSFLIGQPLMAGVSIIGFATVGTNLWFMMKETPGPVDWLLEHIKAIVGTGISVYTAFFAFGAVRIAPAWALTPALWSAPLIVGLGLILFHQHDVKKGIKKPTPSDDPFFLRKLPFLKKNTISQNQRNAPPPKTASSH
ncbi:MAG: hypothetical protein AAF720_07415 [Pseudomonadota bacterium]